MTPVRCSNGRDPGCMTRGRKPVVNRRANLAALHRWFPWTMMTCDQKEDPFATTDRLIEVVVDRLPGAIQIHAVQVEGPVGVNRSGAKPAIPGAVERRAG